MLNIDTGPSASSQTSPKSTTTASQRYHRIREALLRDGILNPEAGADWRISPSAFALQPQDVSFFERLGEHLLRFYRSLNQLYLDSLRGAQPPWVHTYLDQGKPDNLLEYARMKRFRGVIPDVIRPDIIPTDTGMALTELDSVPGGIGITGSLSHTYGSDDDQLIGGQNGMMEHLAAMFRYRMGTDQGIVALVVSDEAEDYRAEMTWVASQLRLLDLAAYCIHPRDIHFTEEALFTETPSGREPIALIYRFFELFDLKNIPKSELVMYAAKKGRVTVTPPYKPWMEEKLALGLLHHPRLEAFWTKALEPATFESLLNVVPRTWIVDPRPLPPSAIIPNLRLHGHAVSDWRELATGTQRQRQYALKPSGFSPLAWGSRGVVIGHDLPQSDWAEALDLALTQFHESPWVLQDFHKGRQYQLTYYDEHTHEECPMPSRVRLSPYYFVVGNQVRLGGILATACPKDKKVLHGMRDAIMVPCKQTTV